ncbi:elongator complex protein 6 [Brachyhypopomus gauderio]|uniref:elongator complex protein 6 n=1 Tax=Brachyhypopomus gauderio TaxID=698409 RepID=UPI004041B9D2
MFPELNSILNTSPDNLKEREFIVLSDRHADASFLIHHYLSFYLRAHCKVCFLGLVQSFSHYSAVSQRLGVNLTQAKEKGQLVFLEALKASPGVLLNEGPNDGKQTFDYLRSPFPELKGLFEFVHGSLSQGGGDDGRPWGPPVLLVDDMSVLLSLGVSVQAILDFTHYCRATICSQLQGSMVVLVRCDDEEWDEDEEGSGHLLRGVTHQCSLSLRVEGLPTGYCRDIHGQVEIWWREKGQSAQSQRQIFQYKVHDKGASFFARGTSSAVL